MLALVSVLGALWGGEAVGAPTLQGSSLLAHLSFAEEHPQLTGFVVGALLLQAGLVTGWLIHRRRRQKMEAELGASEERYRAVVESQSEMVCRYRADATLTFVNAAYCRFFGKSREELIGHSFLKLVPTERHASIMAALQALVGSRQAVTMEHEVLRPDGTTGWMEWQDFVILNKRGDVVELQGIGRDTTERRRAVEALMEAERRLAQMTRLALVGELAASIAHEINQPLGAILSNAEAAEMMLESGSVDEVRQILADIRRDDLRASEVIQNVRRLVSQRRMDARPVSLDGIVAGVSRLVSGDARRRGVLIETQLEPNLPEIEGDHGQLEQAVLNLVLNGMDAMQDTPVERRRLVMAASRQGNNVALRVSDSGHGVAPAKMDDIFESFFTTKEGGMGLGLALVRSIAEAHGARVEVENNPEGGASFRLLVPIANERIGSRNL